MPRNSPSTRIASWQHVCGRHRRSGFHQRARGRARHAVRNSLAETVVEGTGDHCCEYMTGGCVVVLGKVGRSVGAGMTGGLGYFLDEDETFPTKVNGEIVTMQRVESQAGDAARNSDRGASPRRVHEGEDSRELGGVPAQVLAARAPSEANTEPDAVVEEAVKAESTVEKVDILERARPRKSRDGRGAHQY